MDNFHKGCPAKMSDGRYLTDYRTSTRREEYVKYVNNIIRDDDYRLFLQQNAEQIMDNEWKYDKKYRACWVNECVHNYPSRVFPPWFVEERTNYDTLSNPHRTKRFSCPDFHDYRLTVTPQNR